VASRQAPEPADPLSALQGPVQPCCLLPARHGRAGYRNGPPGCLGMNRSRFARGLPPSLVACWRWIPAPHLPLFAGWCRWKRPANRYRVRPSKTEAAWTAAPPRSWPRSDFPGKASNPWPDVGRPLPLVPQPADSWRPNHQRSGGCRSSRKKTWWRLTWKPPPARLGKPGKPTKPFGGAAPALCSSSAKKSKPPWANCCLPRQAPRARPRQRPAVLWERGRGAPLHFSRNRKSSGPVPPGPPPGRAS